MIKAIDKLTSGNLPYTRTAIRAGCRNVPIIGAERYITDRCFMRKRRYFCTRCQVPDFCDSRKCAHGKELPITAHCNVQDLSVGERFDFLPCADVPDVRRCTGYVASLRVRRDP